VWWTPVAWASSACWRVWSAHRRRPILPRPDGQRGNRPRGLVEVAAERLPVRPRLGSGSNCLRPTRSGPNPQPWLVQWCWR
jgi:hypothetical protein